MRLACPPPVHWSLRFCSWTDDRWKSSLGQGRVRLVLFSSDFVGLLQYNSANYYLPCSFLSESEAQADHRRRANKQTQQQQQLGEAKQTYPHTQIHRVKEGLLSVNQHNFLVVLVVVSLSVDMSYRQMWLVVRSLQVKPSWSSMMMMMIVMVMTSEGQMVAVSTMSTQLLLFEKFYNYSYPEVVVHLEGRM